MPKPEFDGEKQPPLSLDELLEKLVRAERIPAEKARDVAARAKTLSSQVVQDRVGSVRSQGAARYEASPAEIVVAAGLHDAQNPKRPLDEEIVAEVVAQSADLPYLKIDPHRIDGELVTRTLSRQFACRHAVIPVGRDGDTLFIALTDPFDSALRESLSSLLQAPLEYVVSTKKDILAHIDRVYGPRPRSHEPGRDEDGVPGSIKQLADDQLEQFDTEYVKPEMWQDLRRRIQVSFPGGRFRFLDIGGGNGVFCDRLLETFPEAEGTVLDNARVLLERNAKSPRKTLVDGSAEHLAWYFEPRSFDLVFLNWVVHHFVVDGYRSTRAQQVEILQAASELTRDAGSVSIFENLYQGRVVDNSPSWLIFQLSRSRSLATLARRGGANTAGVGVCFASEHGWRSVIASAGLEVGAVSRYERPVRLARRALLNVKSLRVGHFWCQRR